MEYRVLTTQIICPPWAKELRAALASDLRELRGIIKQEDTIAPDDSNDMLYHTLSLLQIALHEEKDRDLYELYCGILVRDLQNLLHSYAEEAPNRMLMRLLFRGMLALDICVRPVASLILDYHASYRQRLADKRLDSLYDAALDFDKLYLQAGDRALVIDQDVELAMQFYRLAALDWSDPRDKRERSYSRVMVDRYTRILHAGPGSAVGEHEALPPLNILARIRRFARRSAQHEQCIEASNEFFELYDQYMAEFGDDYDHIRTLMIAAWAAKLHGLLPALCQLWHESEETLSDLAPTVRSNIAAMRLPEAPTRPLTKYLADHEDRDGLTEELLRFAQAIDIARSLQDTLRITSAEQDMAYYTALNTLMYMLPAKCEDKRDWGRLSVMNLAYMNDPNEGMMLHKYLLAGREPEDRGARRIASYPFVFMKCFTSRVDDLPMWEMYGDRAQGVCILVDWQHTLHSGAKARAARNTPLYQVCYLHKHDQTYTIEQSDNPNLKNIKKISAWLQQLRELREDLDEGDPRQFFDGLLNGIAYLFKDSSYHYEQEVRILYSFPEASDQFRHTPGEYPLLFVQTEFPVTIREIVIGPKFPDLARRMPYLREQIELMCQANGTPVPKLTISGIEYR